MVMLLLLHCISWGNGSETVASFATGVGFFNLFFLGQMSLFAGV